MVVVVVAMSILDAPSALTAATAVAAGKPISLESCRRKALLYLEPGRVTAQCTEPAGHDGIHYDEIFSLGWRSKNDAQ